MKLEQKNRLNEFETELSTNHIKDYYMVMMIIEDNVTVGYIVYFSEFSMLQKFEIFKEYRGRGYGLKALKLFLKTIKPYTNTVKLRARNNELIPFYEKFGFKLIADSDFKMILDFNKKDNK